MHNYLYHVKERLGQDVSSVDRSYAVTMYVGVKWGKGDRASHGKNVWRGGGRFPPAPSPFPTPLHVDELLTSCVVRITLASSCGS